MTATKLKASPPAGTAQIVHTDGRMQPAIAALHEAIVTGQSNRVLLVPSVSLGHIHPRYFKSGREYTLPPISHPTIADHAGGGHLRSLIEQTQATNVHVDQGSLLNMLGGDLTRAESVRDALESLARETNTAIVLTLPAPPVADKPQTPEPVDPYVAHGLQRGTATVLTPERAQQVNGLLAAMATTTPALRTWDGHPVTPGTAVIVGSPGRYSGKLHATVFDVTGRGSDRSWDVSRDAFTAFQFVESLPTEKDAQLLIIEGGLGDHDARLSIDLEALAAAQNIAVGILG